MMSFWETYLREPVRKALLRVLILTEKQTESKPVTREEGILRRDIHIPPVIVAALSTGMFLIVLLMQFGWSLR